MENKEFDLEHLRELYEKELSNENNPSEKEPSKEKASDQGRFGEKKATSPSDNVSDTVDQGSFGQKKTQDDEESWICPACETSNKGDFCAVCGEKRPETEKEKREREQREAEEQKRQARELREEAEREKQAREEEKKKKEKNRKPLIIVLCAVAVLFVLFFAIRGGIQKNSAVQTTQELEQTQAPVQAEVPDQENRIRSLTQNYDENTAVTATLNSSDIDNRLVIELIDRNSGTTFSEYKISVNDEDRVERIEHYVEGLLKTTRWLEYESDQLTSYVIELNNQSPVMIGGLGGESSVLSNIEGDLWLWGGPGAPEPFDPTAWEDIDWGSTVIMDHFEMNNSYNTLSLYSPCISAQDSFYSVFVGSVFINSEGFVSGLDLFDFNYSDGLTEHSYDSRLSYMETYEYDESQEAWVSHYDENWEQFVDTHEETTQDLNHSGTDAAAMAEGWNSASKFITVDGVDQAVFLDDSGRTERLLLRSPSDGQICADYRFSWDGDRIQEIIRFDSQGKESIRHDFDYSYGKIAFIMSYTAKNLTEVTEQHYVFENETWTEPSTYATLEYQNYQLEPLDDYRNGESIVFTVWGNELAYETLIVSDHGGIDNAPPMMGLDIFVDNQRVVELWLDFDGRFCEHYSGTIGFFQTYDDDGRVIHFDKDWNEE